VRILVGFPGGSTPDLVARTIAEPLSKMLGQPVIVDNKPGAAGNIAADQVAKSTDEHTIGVMINGNMTIAKLLNPKTPYDPVKDLAPISLIGTAPLLLTAGGKDHTVPASVSRSIYKKQRRSPARTDILEFPESPHMLMAGEGWEQVAAGVERWLADAVS